MDDGSLKFYVGLRHVAYDGQPAMDWVGDSACNAPVFFRAASLGGAMVSASPVMNHCRACRDYAIHKCASLVIVSCITQVFQITTDLQRSTR